MRQKSVEILWENIAIPSIELPTSEGLIDLYSSPFFTSVVHNVKENSLSLFFECLPDGILISEKPQYKTVELKFNSLFDLQIEPIDLEMPREEDDRLTYFSIAEKTMDKHISFLFEFRGGRKIYVRAQSLTIYLSSDTIQQAQSH